MKNPFFELMQIQKPLTKESHYSLSQKILKKIFIPFQHKFIVYQ